MGFSGPKLLNFVQWKKFDFPKIMKMNYRKILIGLLALVLLVGYGWTKSETWSEGLQRHLGNIKEKVQDTMERVGDKTKEPREKAQKYMGKGWNKTKETVGGVYGDLKEAIGKKFDKSKK